MTNPPDQCLTCRGVGRLPDRPESYTNRHTYECFVCHGTGKIPVEKVTLRRYTMEKLSLDCGLWGREYIADEDHDRTVAALQAKIADAEQKQISGFYEDRVPEFRQGPPTHELQDLVTAEEVQRYVKLITELQADNERLRTAYDTAHGQALKNGQAYHAVCNAYDSYRKLALEHVGKIKNETLESLDAVRLMKFYAVENISDLLITMEGQIERLQKRLPPEKDERPGYSPREG